MSLLLLFGGGSAPVVPVDPETVPLNVAYSLDERVTYDLDARVLYEPDNREAYPL